MEMNTLALFGAGKIGRSFIAQVFARNGYKVVFIDIDTNLINAINQHGRYKVVILNNDGSRHEHWVEGVRAIDGRDSEACTELLSQVSLMATSVGAGAIPAVCKTIAAAMPRRRANGSPPFDLILAENMRAAAAVARKHLIDCGVPTDEHPGLVEASIGKTAPDVPAAEQAEDPLRVYADSYNTLVVSATGWKGEAPQFPELYLAKSITAYVDRKLFIHNTAHCALAYFGHRALPSAQYIHQIIEHAETRAKVQSLIDITAQAVAREHPDEFTAADMRTYTEEVFERIANPGLRDSVWRVGRDIPRKLGRTERIVGSLLLAVRHGLPTERHISLYAATLSFHARDEHGQYAAMDRQFHRDICWNGVSHAVHTISQLDDTEPKEHEIIKDIKNKICFERNLFKGGVVWQHN